EGAGLGALWLASEWTRYELVPGALTRTPEGQTVTGAIWLSLGPTLAGRASKVADCLQTVAGDRKLPTALVHGADDAASTEFARVTMLALNKRKLTQRLTGQRVIPGRRNAGIQLPRASPPVEKIVLQEAAVFDDQSSAAWSVRQTDRKAYFWQ